MNKLQPFAASCAVALFLTACGGPDHNQPQAQPQPSAPIANAGIDQEVVENTDVTLNGTGTDSDGQVVAYSWAQLEGPDVTLSPTDEADSGFRAPSVAATEQLTFQLTVTDNEGNQGSDVMIITVTNDPIAPTVDAGADTTASENTVVMLSANATRGDGGNVVHYEWTQLNGSDVIINQDTADPNADFTAPEVSETVTYSFRVTVTDDQGNMASDDINVAITNVHVAPVADAGPDQAGINEGDTVDLDGSASTDSNGTIVSYEWQQIGGSELTINNADNSAPDSASFIAPTSDSNTRYTVELTITDNDGDTSTDQVEIEVIGDSNAPIARAGDDQQLIELSPEKTPLVITLDGSASTAGDGIQSYEWALTSVLPAGSEDVVLDDDSVDQPSFTLPDVHRETTYEFTLTLTDNSSATDSDTVQIVVTPYLEERSRYAHNNQCYVMYSNDNEFYVEETGGNYSATALEPEDAIKLWLRPAALGEYIVYTENRDLFTNTGNALTGDSFGVTPLETATEDTAVFTLTASGDDTQYPTSPQFHIEPNDGQLGVAEGTGTIATYRNFSDPEISSNAFNLAMGTSQLGIDANNALTLTTASGADSQKFYFEKSPNSCPEFPEATSNTKGDTYSGTVEYTDAAGDTKDIVVGHADTHVHVSSNNFLGMTQWGRNFHPLGAHHALDDCDEFHGNNGSQDTVGTLFGIDPANPNPTHDITGFPTFPQWPARGELTHEAIYWQWLERSWKAGLRIVVNDLVDNETLCELQRPSSPDPLQDCNAMNNAGKQVGTMYALQDYVDAQYGGRGKGWFQIVTSPEAARDVVADGKMAVIFGIEISNFLDCKVVYRPTRQQEPYQEDGSTLGENEWRCTMTGDPNAPNHVDRQMDRLWKLGVRQIISIHEFDNALGGNGIFDALVLNAGNRENSGGIPVGGIDLVAAVTGGLADPFSINPPDSANPLGDGTGEFWTTYDCPQTSDTGTSFGGYFGSGGTVMQGICLLPEPFKPYLGQNGRPGGATPCYPDAAQCNARLMTPIGLYVYKRMMEIGFIFDWDHMEIGMKTQALMLAEAQDPPYPFVSTHGNFGGTTIDQVERLYANGGNTYPSLGGASSFKNRVLSTKAIWEAADPTHRVAVFGMGYGTDTNGLSGQAGPRGGTARSDRPVSYPFTLFGSHDRFSNPQIDALLGSATEVIFEQPCVVDPALAGDDKSGADCAAHVLSNPSHGRSWHIDIDGSAQYGMSADFVEELNVEASVSADYVEAMEALFLSAEAYLRTWEKTLLSRDGILANDNGGKTKEPAFDILRPAARRPGGGGPSEDINDPAKNHYDVWGTSNDPYVPARP